jgi:hypothetical protein
MRAKTGTTVKLVGVLEAMGMALPKARARVEEPAASITDTRLPVGFADDEFDDYDPEAIEREARRWIAATPDDASAAEQESVEVAVIEQRRSPEAADGPVGRNQGAWARAHSEPHILHRMTRHSNARMRSYSVAYYRSEHARATGTESGSPVLEAPRVEHRTSGERRAVDHFEAMGYRGRHRFFKG